MIFFATASANQNDLVEKEVRASGAEVLKVTPGGVEFEADLETAYRFAIWTRCATKLLVLVHQYTGLESADDLYEHSLTLPWENWVGLEKTFAITETVTNCRWLNNSHFAALRFKDAIVERCKSAYNGERPNVDRDNPDIIFHLHINKNQAAWYVDFGGRKFSHRGYRSSQTDAVMSEFLAASLVYRSEWYRHQDLTFLDPMCGSGTLCIEAALIATNTAPGLLKKDSFGFTRLPIHNPELYRKVLDEAESQKRPCPCKIIGWDIDADAVEISEENAQLAGVSSLITFDRHDFRKTTKEDALELSGYCDGEYKGVIVTDPPYGVRLSQSFSNLSRLYSAIGSITSENFGAWYLTVLCADPELLSYIEMKPDRTNILINGGLECQAAHYYIFSEAQRQALIEKALQKKKERLESPLTPGAQMAANRLKKNLASIGKEMEKQGVTCYRLYDADMPEYSAAIDIYENKWINLQEYAAPSSIDPEDAKRRLEELVLATERVTGIDLDDIHIKRREIQKGKDQYNKKGTPSASHFFMAGENGHRFVVNFQDYLDTGIFLDHRPVRKMIEEQSEGKRFLNLFCYTGTATVHAAAGGALSTVSVDASSTYLDWAMRNMKLNGFSSMNHFYYRGDCLEWLRNTNDKFDLIFCDPPTFSNSKSRSMFDVQRDHGYLIRSCMRHLSRDGKLIFSTNFTRFKLYEELFDEFEITDITQSTIGEDFARNPKIHKCYEIRHRNVAAKQVRTVHVKTVRHVTLKEKN